MCKQNCADINLISYGNLLSCWQYIYRNVYLLIWYLASWSCPGSWWLTGWRQEGEMGSSEREQGVDGDGVSVSWLNCAVLELTGVMRKTVTHPLSLTLVWLTVHTSTVDASVLLQNIIRTRWRLWQKKKKNAVCILLLCACLGSPGLILSHQRPVLTCATRWMW